MRGKVARALRRLSDYKVSEEREYIRGGLFDPILCTSQRKRLYKAMKKQYMELKNGTT